LFSNAQKKIEKILVLEEDISAVVFDLEHVFSINLKSAKNSKVTVRAISEGEYANHFVVTEKSTGNLMKVSGRIAFTFPNNQDKLSAHKVHAIAIEITVPERLKTTLISDIGNLNATGFYQQLTANLKSGNCMLNQASGHLIIQTVNGNISLTVKNAQVISETRTGLVTQQQLIDGKSMFKLKTIKGNINIEQSK
jgi:hypothetical protein